MVRGFTYLEMLLTLGLMALVLSFGLSRGKSSTLTAQTLAGQIAAELRVLRTEAMASRSPLAMGFPRQGASLHCQSYYLLKGMEQPQVYRSYNQARSGLSLAPGCWGSLLQPAPSSTSYLDLAAWGLPHPTDAIVAFDSRGSLCTNLPLMEESCSIVCGPEVAYLDQAGTAQLLRSQSCWSVVVHRSGRVDVSAGPSLSLAGTSLDSLPAAARPVTRSANQVPDLALQVSPPPSLGVPPSVVTTCLVGRFLTLTAESRDLDGDSLSVQWRCPQGGQFSSSQPEPMEWQPQERLWRSRWTWTPPANANTGDLFSLSCRVSDPRGSWVEKNLETNVANQVMALNDGSIYFSSDRSGFCEVYRCNSDGSDVQAVTNIRSTTQTNPCVSPDGSKILIRYGKGGAINYWVVNRDGSNLRQVTDKDSLTPPADWTGDACWSPDGRKVVYSMVRGNANDLQELYWCNLDGSDNIRLSQTTHPIEVGYTAAHAPRPRWQWIRPAGPNPIFDPNDLSAHRLLHNLGWGSGVFATSLQTSSSSDPSTLVNPDLRDYNFNRDFTKVAFVTSNASFEVQVGDWDGSNVSNLVTLPNSTGSWLPYFSPDGGSLVFTRYTGGNTDPWVARIDGSEMRRLTDNPAMDEAYSWGP